MTSEVKQRPKLVKASYGWSQWVKFGKGVKYANEMTDDVILSTQFYIKYINRAILANLQCRPLKFGRLIVLQETHQQLHVHG